MDTSSSSVHDERIRSHAGVIARTAVLYLPLISGVCAMEPAPADAAPPSADSREPSSSGVAHLATVPKEPCPAATPGECADRGGRPESDSPTKKEGTLDKPSRKVSADQPRTEEGAVAPPPQTGEASSVGPPPATKSRKRRADGRGATTRARPKETPAAANDSGQRTRAGQGRVPGDTASADPAERRPRESESVLCFQQRFVHLVLDGRKTLDIRHTQIHSKEYWIANKGMILGRAVLTFRERIESLDRWTELTPEHCWDSSFIPYRRCTAFSITDVHRLTTPILHKRFHGYLGKFTPIRMSSAVPPPSS